LTKTVSVERIADEVCINSSRPEVLNDELGHEYHLRYSNLIREKLGDYNPSQPKLRYGWIEDAEGRCRMWIPGQWHSQWNPSNWDHNTSATAIWTPNGYIIIKL